MKKNHVPVKDSKIENPLMLESIGYVKTHEPNVDPNVEMRIYLNEKALNQVRYSNLAHILKRNQKI